MKLRYAGGGRRVYNLTSVSRAEVPVRRVRGSGVWGWLAS